MSTPPPSSGCPDAGDLPRDAADDRAAELVALADWMTEEVAQQLYAARQDFADIAHEDDTKRADVEDVNAQLLLVIRSLHEIAGVLRTGALDARRASTAERLADDLRTTSAGAHELIAACLELVDRSLVLRGATAPDDPASGSPGP